MSSKVFIDRLDSLDGEDKEDAHAIADGILIVYLLSLKGERADVARAYDRARDRIGFWYC